VCLRTAEAVVEDVGRPFFNWYAAVRQTVDGPGTATPAGRRRGDAVK
jgi:hypothetical protein